MKLEPLEERVIVEVEAEIKSKLIYIPDSSKEYSLVGIVREIGPDCIRVKPGDKVLYGRYSGAKTPFKEEYNDCRCMNESDILAIIKEEN